LAMRRWFMIELSYCALDAIGRGETAALPGLGEWVEAFRTIGWVVPTDCGLGLTPAGRKALAEMDRDRREHEFRRDARFKASDRSLELEPIDLTDEEWRLIEPLLPSKPRSASRMESRRVVSGIFHVLRTGAAWRDLPDRYGPYTTVYNHFTRWAKAGVWQKVFEVLATNSPESLRLIDGSMIDARQDSDSARPEARFTASAPLAGA
jgi:transposase